MPVPRPLRKYSLPWFYVTRVVGASMVLYGMIIDTSPERGTIILGGLGLLGVEKVAKSDPPKQPNGKSKE